MRRSGKSSASNQGVFCNQALLRQLGCGSGSVAAPKSRQRHHCGHPGFGSLPQMPLLRIAADNQRQRHIADQRDHTVAPGARTDRRWRQVRAFGVVAGETKRHGYDSDLGPVVKRIGVDAHPVAQPIPRRVGERTPAGVGFQPGGLTRDQNPRLGAEPYYRSRRVRGGGGRKPFGADRAAR